MRRKPTNRLRVVRTERALTQIELAFRAGLSRDRYWHIENGYKQPTPEELRSLTRVLRVSKATLGFAAPAELAQAS